MHRVNCVFLLFVSTLLYLGFTLMFDALRDSLKPTRNCCFKTMFNNKRRVPNNKTY